MSNGDDVAAEEEVVVTREEVVTAVLRGVKDGIRDEVLNWPDVADCINDKTLDALQTLVEKANAKRRKLPKEDRRPWRTETPADVVAAQQVLRDAGLLPLSRPDRRKLLGAQASVTTFPAKINGGDDGNG